MAPVWRRGISTSVSWDRWNYAFTNRIPSGATLLRMYVSWHVVGDAWTVNEPLLVGMQYILTNASIIFPNDPMDTFGRLSEQWVRAGMYAPIRDPQIVGEPYRMIWPRSGHELWDIESNRKPTGANHVAPYLVWALPQESHGMVYARYYWAALIDFP